MANWTLETIAWDRFDASKVDPEILRNIKAAAMVERNGRDYGVYLRQVFADDPAVVEEIERWALEEVQHGLALGRWAQMADPAWDFDGAFARFRAGYRDLLGGTWRNKTTKWREGPMQLNFTDKEHPITKGIADFGQKAKTGTLSYEDLTGGTFSITNGGIFGSLLSTPILNPPQSAILGMHAVKERAGDAAEVLLNLAG